MKKMNADSKTRLTNEYMTVASRLDKLNQFLERVGDSPDLDVKLLRRQARVMSEYAEILETRIKLDDAKREEVSEV